MTALNASHGVDLFFQYVEHAKTSGTHIHVCESKIQFPPILMHAVLKFSVNSHNIN